MTLSMKSLAVTVLLALLVAVTLAVLLVPSASWAAMYEWITTSMTAEPPCACSMAPASYM
jgi:hypothetical protein